MYRIEFTLESGVRSPLAVCVVQRKWDVKLALSAVCCYMCSACECLLTVESHGLRLYLHGNSNHEN